ncbi:GDSL-type esterase/lipase family protein [Soonwooa sp.]|uniref:SGNH/GDSL hydrolase family protein n=1 Tax=Soonwooa sp. TaxID=1938592 RepID=UPI002623C196|nr:GDSL-type esterase/lipase family protein [Soonwooa sp.]
MTNSLFFGDSITYGEYDGILGGWVDNLKRYLHSRYYNDDAKEVNAFNLGIGGENTKGLLSRINNEILARLSPEHNLIFLFYGANDLAIKNNQETIPVQEFEINIKEAVKIAKRYTTEIYLISIIPIKSEIDGVTVSSGKTRTNARVNLYNKVLERVSVLEDVTYLDINSKFSKFTDEYISKDGIHPNEKGYQVISDCIKPILEKYL